MPQTKRKPLKYVLLALSTGLIALGLLAFWQLRFAEELTKYYDEETGNVLIGYDRIQKKWLFDEPQAYEPGPDGPYIFSDRSRVMQVIPAGDSFMVQVGDVRRDTFTCMVDNVDRNMFGFRLMDSIVTPPATCAAPERLLAVSDIEGNFRAFAMVLIGNGVVDRNLNWIFGSGHLVLNGDFMDRGDNVTQCLWLIYKLEQEAAAAGGRVHYILGNHEQLNLQGNLKYVAGKYRELIRRTGLPYRDLYGPDTELGKWLRSRNVIEKIGEDLYVHGGLSPEIAAQRLSPEQMNTICRRFIDRKQPADGLARQLLGMDGLLWYRGLVGDKENKLSAAAVNASLDAIGARRIIVGHTIVNEVSADCNGRVIRLDVHHAATEPQALWVEGGRYYRTDARGTKTLIAQNN